jgi:integral membrane protein
MSGMTPRSLFRAVAIAELVTWTLLIVGMLMKYVFGLGDLGVRIGGSIHGFVFLAYLVVTTIVAVNQRWSFRTTLVGWASAIVPYTTLPFEVGVARRGMLEGDWRRGPVGSDRVGFLDRLLFLVVRHPLAAALIGVLLVAVVFAVLLVLGPPIPSR